MPQKIYYSTNKIQSNGNNCCSIQPKGKQECPKCQKTAKGVLRKTLEHLLKKETKSALNSLDGFYYCKTPQCNVIYFRDKEILKQEDINAIVGLKNGAHPANMCYCFGWTKERIKEDIKQNGKSKVLVDIKSNMNTIGCSCEIKNPSGNCCMADISKFLKELSYKN